MNARIKEQPKPPATLEELHIEQAELEQALIAAERSNSTARTDLKNAIGESDAEAINAARETIRRSAADIAELGTDLAATREMVHHAQARAHVTAQMNRMTVIERLAGEMVKTSETLEKDTVRWAASRKAAIAAAAEYEAELSRNSVGFDPYLSIAVRLDARVDLLFWVSTEGTYGRCRTLDSLTQLRESRRASLGLAATEFRAFTLRHARGLFGIPPEAPNG